MNQRQTPSYPRSSDAPKAKLHLLLRLRHSLARSIVQPLQLQQAFLSELKPLLMKFFKSAPPASGKSSLHLGYFSTVIAQTFAPPYCILGGAIARLRSAH